MKPFSVVPHITIKVDGSEISSELIQTIHAIRINQILSAPSQCEIEVPEAHQQISTEILSKIGSLIEIKIDQYDSALFYGQITAVELAYNASSKPFISIRAYDLLHQLRKRQPIRTHNQVNLHQLAHDITHDMAITVKGGESTPTIPSLYQYRQSDLQILHEFGESYGQYFFLNNKELQFFPLSGTSKKESLKLGDNLLEVQFSINAETVTDSVTASGWNTQHATSHSMTAQQFDSVINNDFQLNSSDFSSDGKRTFVDHNIQNDQQAEIIAQKELDRHMVQQLTLWGVAEGNPFLTPGSAVQVVGVSANLEGKYVLTEVRHSIDPVKGYISEINTSPPRIEKTKQNKNAMIGIVSQVNDPDNLARIKVTLPTYNNIETEWLEVLSLGAGSNKGQLILPDVGDTVLLLNINNEPSQAIVLGGVFGENDLPKSVVENGIVKRFITKTAGNQKIYLDDEEASIKIETQTGHNIKLKPGKISIVHNNGSSITLSENNMTIHSETNLNIEAPGRSITFRGRKIDFEEA